MRTSFSIVITTLVLTACGGEHSDVKAWMAEESKGMVGRVQPIPEIKSFPIISYDAGDFPDPFAPSKIVPEKHSGGLEPDRNWIREPLEDYPLESLKMVGVMNKGKGGRYALIQIDNATTIYHVRIGNHMGQNYGAITAITETQITVKELVQDPTGQTADWVERLSTLELQEQSPLRKEATR